MDLEQGQNDADEPVMALTPAQLAIVLAVLVIVFFAVRMKRAR